MRLARVLGNVTLATKLPQLRNGTLLLVEALDSHGLGAYPKPVKRATPMPDSMVVFDELGAGVGQIIAVSEGREATQPFYPEKIVIDAYCSAIIDTLEIAQK